MSTASAAPGNGKIIPHLVVPAATADNPMKLAQVNQKLQDPSLGLSPLRRDSKWVVMSTTDGPERMAEVLQVLATIPVTALVLLEPAGPAGGAAPADTDGEPVPIDSTAESIPN